MKKISFMITVLMLCLFVSGCDMRSDLEKTLFNQCDLINKSAKVSCTDHFENTIQALECDNVCKNDPNIPFQKQLNIFRIEESTFKLRYPNAITISEIYYQSTGLRIYELYSNSTIPTTNQEIKKVNDKYILSPALYDELINAVRSCNRAVISSTQFKMGAALTPDQYDAVMTIIGECKQYQLEKAINEK